MSSAHIALCEPFSTSHVFQWEIDGPQAFSQYLLGTQVGITVMKFTFLNWLFDIFVPCNIVLLLCEISILHPAEGLFHVY